MSHTTDIQEVQSNNLDYGYIQEATDQPTYATLQTLQPVDTAGKIEMIYISPSGQYYSLGPNAVTYSQTESDVTQEITEGQYLSQESEAYYNQEDVDPDTVHALTATQTNYLQSVTADVGEMGYIVPSNTATCISSLDDDGQPDISPNNPIGWLMKNFQLAEGMSVPRSTLYMFYLHHCNENNLTPLTASSLGKLISKIFFGLKTRRLGKRGKSN